MRATTTCRSCHFSLERTQVFLVCTKNVKGQNDPPGYSGREYEILVVLLLNTKCRMEGRKGDRREGESSQSAHGQMLRKGKGVNWLMESMKRGASEELIKMEAYNKKVLFNNNTKLTMVVFTADTSIFAVLNQT